MDMQTNDMRPSLGEILDGYQRLSYKPETAIAEFVDNSTASYFEMKKNAQDLGMPINPLLVEITYDADLLYLEVKDNAQGMDRQTLSNALTIGKRPAMTQGRNEYGMGMKTAASWFGKEWSIETKKASFKEIFRANVDILDLKATKQNEITISSSASDSSEHYTILHISKLNRRIFKPSIQKLIYELSSIYRHDINSGDITITFNGQKLSYLDPEIYTEAIDDTEIIWKREFPNPSNPDEEEPVVDFYGTKYPFRGYIAIRKEGKYNETGLTLCRRGRVIIGGSGKNFKPEEIFGAANSPQSLRLFGEFHLDSWPVTQAKDAFDWDDGLRDEFVLTLKELISDYIDKSKKVRTKDDTKVNSTQVKSIGHETTVDLGNLGNIEDYEDIDNSGTLDINQIESDTNIVESEDQNVQVSLEEDIPSYTTTVNILNNTYTIKVDFLNDSDALLIDLKEINDGNIPVLNIIFNAAHPYFNEINNNKQFVKLFQKYLVLQIISEKFLTKISTKEGLVYPYQVRETINRMLDELKDKMNN